MKIIYIALLFLGGAVVVKVMTLFLMEGFVPLPQRVVRT